MSLSTYILITACCASYTCINVVLAEHSTDNVHTCKHNEYFHVDNGNCMECASCREGEYMWIPCSDTADTICGPLWSPNVDNKPVNDATPSSKPCGSCNHSKRDDNVILIMVSACIVVSTLIVIGAVIVATSHAIQRKRDVYYRQDKESIDHMLGGNDV